jgi:hypothetical protein
VTLILHAGAEPVEYDALRHLPVPEATSAHVRIPHHRVGGGGTGDAGELGSGSGAEAVCAGAMIVASSASDHPRANTSSLSVAALAALADVSPSGDTGPEPCAELLGCSGAGPVVRIRFPPAVSPLRTC